MEKEKPQSDKATFTFGRLSPPTIGHKKLIDHVVDHAHATGADHHIFLSQSHDPKKNPLSHSEKVEFAKKFFPYANIHHEKDIKTPIDAYNHLHKKGYKHVTMIVGGDRVQDMSNLLQRCHAMNPGSPTVSVKSAGERDPDAEGVEGMSASKMRDHAAKKNFKEFKKGVPNPVHAKELYHAVRKGMKLEGFQNHFKALFLVGGPGSGKDFIISTLLEQANLKEFPLEKLANAIHNCENLDEFNSYPSLIVNGNADNLEKIKISKAVLESIGYDTAMIYVYTTDDESRSRNNERINRGSKTISENVRSEKYSASIKNLHSFSPMFNKFHIFDNSYNYSSVGQIKREEILGWLNELGESISDFFTSSIKDEKAIVWLMENTRWKNQSPILTEGGNVKIGEHAAFPISVNEKNRPEIQSDIHHSLSAIHDSMKKEHGIELFGHNKKALETGSAYSGSSKHLMSPSISHKEFAAHKPSVGDVDVQIPKEHAETLAKHLQPGKHFGNYQVLGLKKHGEETTALMKHYSGHVHQFDFEHVNYEKNEPTKEEQFLHSSSWEDSKKGIKGVHHKIILNSAGTDKNKFSITHGLRSRTDEKDEGIKNPEKVTHKLFGPKADSSKIHSFHGVVDLIKHHVPKEHHEEIYRKFKDTVAGKGKVDHTAALSHLRKTLGIKEVQGEESIPSSRAKTNDWNKEGGNASDTPMAKDYKLKIKKQTVPTVKEAKDPSANPTGNPFMFTNSKKKGKSAKKGDGEKAATPPPNFFDSRMGMVPSGGVGITVSHTEYDKNKPLIREKTFERLRKNLSAVLNNIDEKE